MTDTHYVITSCEHGMLYTVTTIFAAQPHQYVFSRTAMSVYSPGVAWQAITVDELERFLLVLAASHRAIRTGHNRTVRDL
jgi:hypothetical protein